MDRVEGDAVLLVVNFENGLENGLEDGLEDGFEDDFEADFEDGLEDGGEMGPRIRAATPAAAALYRYAPGELDGLPLAVLAPPGASPSVAGIVAQRRKDGSFFVAELRTEPTSGGLRIEVREAGSEAHAGERERERLVRALRESEERFHLLFDVGPLARWLYDVETLRIVAVNDIAVRHYGFERDEMLAMGMADLRAPDAADASAPGSGPAAHRLRRKDGSIVEVELSSHALTLDGRTVMLVSAQDISERRRLVEQLLHAQKMEALGRLAGGVAHDFNNLLAVILVVSEWVARQLGDGHKLFLEIEEIRTAALRAAALTRQLLAFSRQQVLAPRVFALDAVVTDLERMLRRLIGEDVELEVALPPETPAVRADLGQIEQVVVNLAVNARDAMPHGGLLRITTGAVDLDDDAAAAHGVEPGRYAVLGVSDTGVGMDAKVRAHIFEPFFTTKETGKGTGLGLSTVSSIVRQAGGAIDVRSQPGDGTTFRVFLPAAEAAKSIDELTRERPPRSLETSARPTILLVEDHEQIRSAIRRILQAHGHHVVEAPSGESAELAALELAERHQPVHVLLTDVVMPGADGRALATRLRAVYPRLRVIYMSGYARHPMLDDDLRREAGTSFLAKPFSVDQLAAAVRSALDH